MSATPAVESRRAVPSSPLVRHALMAVPLAVTASLGLPTALHAAESTTAAATLPRITITASRTERDADELPVTASAQDAEAIARRQARDLKSLLADEAGVTVPQQPARFSTVLSGTGRAGNAGLNVRGLEGNQVLMLLDGARLPQSFSFGPFVTGRGDFIEPELLSTAEILRGPTSAQLGSDGLAGALVLRTLRPQDLLGRGKTVGGFVRTGLDRADASGVLTAAVAAGTPQLRGLVALSHRRGHELDNQGNNTSTSANRTAPNPADTRSTTALVKVEGDLLPGHRWDAAMESRRRDVSTQVLSAVSTSSLSTTTDDRTERDRVSLGHHWRADPAARTGLIRWDTTLHVQQAEIHQFSAEDRATLADRTRDNRYRERSTGLSSEGQFQLDGAVPQRVTVGTDLSRIHFAARRDGTLPPTGETFPSRPFPDTKQTLLGAFLQSEIELGHWTVMPALRHDRYQLSPSSEGYTGSVASLRGNAWSPRLGAIWRLDPAFMPYAQWASGFRSPEPDQLNSAFSNPVSGYTSIGNPALKPERSQGIELGLRGRADTLKWHVAVFDNRYRDFIEQVTVGGSGTTANPTVYQSVNLDRARIRGGEARTEWNPAGPWKLHGALAFARGDKERAGTRTPLNSVDPWHLKIAAEYDTGHWSAGLHWTHLAAKSSSRIDSATLFAPGKADVFDLRGHWQMTPTLRLQAAVLNLTDRRYWRWSDVRGLARSSTVIDGYSAPGRSVQVSLRADF